MFKSKFIKDTDIISEKPNKFKKINPKAEDFFIFLYDETINIPMKNINEYFLNNDKTIINCKILESAIKFGDGSFIYDNYVNRYFYENTEEPIEFSSSFGEITGKLNFPHKSSTFEFLFNDNNELMLSILIANTNLK